METIDVQNVPPPPPTPEAPQKRKVGRPRQDAKMIPKTYPRLSKTRPKSTKNR